MTIEKITCPNCAKEFEVRTYGSVNLTKEPFRLKQILNGKFNVSTCPKCKATIKHRSHVLVTKLGSKPEWIWLVSKKHQIPTYKEQFLRTILPEQGTDLISQKVVFVDFGKPAEGLRFVLSDAKPQTKEDWLEYGKILAGEEAINCYQKALRINKDYTDAKKLLHEELDKLKTYT
ncbi:MAG: CpXC domain-containing protein [Candidatus Heimdallarchaeaceae archaeon]